MPASRAGPSPWERQRPSPAALRPEGPRAEEFSWSGSFRWFPSWKSVSRSSVGWGGDPIHRPARGTGVHRFERGRAGWPSTPPPEDGGVRRYLALDRDRARRLALV